MKNYEKNIKSLYNSLSFNIENIKSTDKFNIQQLYFKDLQTTFSKIQGKRNSMDDFYYFDIIDDIKILGLFDGHSGKEISNILPSLFKNVNKCIIKYKNFNTDYNIIKENIYKEYIKIDKILYKKNFKKQGSTAILLYIFNEKIITINLGDSKTLILNYNMQNKFESIQHRPNSIIEYDRIINSKCNVTNNNGIYRINNELAVSKSFGDFKFKFLKNKYDGVNSAVSIIPDIYSFSTIENYIIIIATDGFWDFINFNEITKIISQYNFYFEINKISQNLILQAIKNGSNDNISLILMNYNA